MSKHTEGPWKVCGCGHCGLVWAADEETLIHDNPDGNDVQIPDEEHLQANANLISSAPDLLEALQDLMDEQNGPPLIRDAPQWEAAMDKARAAIAKAEGS
jgi:hypothetical protein